jgi:ankyrin repeat protein
VELLLKCGANVNATGSNGESALMWASSCGYLDVMQTLMDCGANVDMSDNDGFTALTGAAGGNQVKAMINLVKRGASIDKTNNDGFTALMYASSLGHVKSVRTLLQLGADPTACANDGATALIFAAMGGFTETAQALLDNVRGTSSSSSSSPTKTEKLSEDQLEDYHTYLEATTCGDEPVSALSAASYGGHLDTVKMLLERGASVEYPDDDSKMPLMAAASAGHSEIVRLLLEADPKSIDVTETSGRGGSSALMKAALSGHSEVLRVLLEAGADPFKRDSQNMSPLLAAIRGKHVECAKLLKAAMKKSQRLDDTGVRTEGKSGEEKEERESVRWAMLGEEDENDVTAKDLPTAPTLRDRQHERNSRRAERGVECDVSCQGCVVS